MRHGQKNNKRKEKTLTKLQQAIPFMNSTTNNNNNNE